MSAIYLSEADINRAREVEREIGRSVRAGRKARGEMQKNVGYALNTTQAEVGRVEQGKIKTIANAVRFLARYNLTLAVVPMEWK